MFLFLLILCSSTYTFGQQTNNDLITGDFNKVSFEQFAKKIEAQTSFHFYFDPVQLDSFEITISVAKVHLPSLLNQVFHNTDLHYTIEKEQVFITRGFVSPNESGTGFFNRGRDSIAVAQEKASDYSDYIRPAKKVVQEISIENKLFEIGLRVNTLPKGNVNLAGYIRDGLTGEAISGAAIYVEKPHIQVASDQFGYYSIILPPDAIRLQL